MALPYLQSSLCACMRPVCASVIFHPCLTLTIIQKKLRTYTKTRTSSYNLVWHDTEIFSHFILGSTLSLSETRIRWDQLKLGQIYSSVINKELAYLPGIKSLIVKIITVNLPHLQCLFILDKSDVQSDLYNHNPPFHIYANDHAY